MISQATFRRALLGLVATAAVSANAQIFPIGIAPHTDSMKTVQVGVVSTIAVSQTRGMQLSGFSNMSAAPLKGLQLSGVSNISMGVARGAQMASLLNISSGKMNGAQTAVYNFADSVGGAQVGIINVAVNHTKGWQIGLMNITGDTPGRKIGLVNINPQTNIDALIYGGNTTMINSAARFSNRSTYSIAGVGLAYKGFEDKFSGAIFYRLGQHKTLGKRWDIGADIGYSHIEIFEKMSAGKPMRLFSLQARATAEYRIGEKVSAFVNAGYHDTRHYHKAAHYQKGIILEGGLALRFKRYHQTLPQRDTISVAHRHLITLSEEPRPWIAAAEATGINVFVHLFDRFALNADYAQTNIKTWKRNLTDGFVWDNDQFSTNLFAHPYHGNLYYNAARSNGLSFWASAPYAAGGSLMWEMLGEREPPAINDLIATTMGGICIGEVTNRVSTLFIDESAYGFERFIREALTTIVNPMRGFNRIVSGKAWRLKTPDSSLQTATHPLVDLSLSTGDRYLADNGALFRGEHNPYLNIYLEHGNVLNEGDNNRPYDFFDLDVTFGMSPNQPLINNLQILGRLWSSQMISRKGINAEIGFYQHFNYFDSKPVKDGSQLTPYRISEAASVGPGFVVVMPQVGALNRLEQRLFVSGILLGGTKSDYYNVIDRDYNMGSGYSIKAKTHAELRNFGRFILNTKFFELFTWKGYETKDLNAIEDLLYLNVQGDRGRARLLVVNPMLEIDLRNKWSISLAGSYYYRKTSYKYHDNVEANTFDLRMGLTYHI